jgi:hypothetical protein
MTTSSPRATKVRHRNTAIALILVVIILLSAGFYLHVSPLGPLTRLVVRSTGAGSCLLEVPSDANIAEYHNSTTVGNFVTYSNGTRSFFDAASCPQPATPSIYEVATLVVSDPSFIRAENGSAFFLDVQNSIDVGPLQVIDNNGTTLTYSQMTFVEWGNPLDPRVSGCSGPAPISTLTTRYFEAAELQVTIPNLKVVFVNGQPQNLPNRTSDLDFAHMMIQTETDSSLNGFGCTTSG